LPTDKTFTGQRVEAGIGGIMDFNARYYDPTLGRFLSADTIYDGGLADPQGLNRYSYVKGRPLVMTDPSGHNGALTCMNTGCQALQQVLAYGAAAGATVAYMAANPPPQITVSSTPLDVAPALTNSAGNMPASQTPLVLANPTGSGPATGGVESFPTGGEAPPLVTTTPLGGSATLAAGPWAANPNGSPGNPDHQRTTGQLVNDLGNQWGPGYTVGSNVSIKGKINANTGQTISLNRRPDAVVFNSKGEVVEVGEAYRTLQGIPNRPVTRELAKEQEYITANIPSTGRKVK
jgi:RHS repeat-associated protein